MSAPISSDAIAAAAEKYLVNVGEAAVAATISGCPFWLLCAVLEKESGGRNVYGHDPGGAMSLPGVTEVTEANWATFRQIVLVEKRTSNGVGPLQLTYPGFFLDMEKQKMRPWIVADNMLYGARLVASYWETAKGTQDERIARVGKSYNAGPNYTGQLDYADDLVKVAAEWRARLTLMNIVTLNCRLPSMSDDSPDDLDENIETRVPRIRALLEPLDLDVMLLQECDLTYTLKPLLKGFKSASAYAGFGKVWTAWNVAVWRMVGKPLLYPLADNDANPRRFVLVQLESIATGGRVWVGNTHLSVHFKGEAAWRIKQAEDINAQLVKAGLTAADPLVIGGDFNDSILANARGVRQSFAQGPLKLTDLRTRIGTAEMHGDGYNTSHSYGARKNGGRWIDDLLTSPTLRATEGWVKRTDASSPANVRFATDHNAVAAKMTTAPDEPDPGDTMAYSPQAIKDLYAYVEKNLGRRVRNGGIYAQKSGYHNSYNGNKAGWPGDYSISDAPADQRGDKNAARALDISPESAETQRWLTSRCLAWAKSDDPRAWPVREVIGSIDSKNVSSWSRLRSRPVPADRSHITHVHLSIYTEYATDADAMLGVAELICGVPLDESKTKHATKPPTPPPPVAIAQPVYLDKLVEGSTDSDSVRAAQEALVKLGAKNIAATGDFGPGTTEAVKAFQRSQVTGVLTEEEASRLFKLAAIPVVIEKES